MASLDLAGIITRVCTDLRTRFAALSHTHAIADVTDLQSSLNGKAAFSHMHTASAVASGTLDVARIPTGTTSGTVALGDHTHSGYVSMSTATASLTTSGWSSNQKTVSVSGVTASNNVIVAPAPASVSAYAEAGIVCTAQGAGTLTFTRTSANTAAITANVLILE